MSKKLTRGFTLVEVLVTLVILTFGLLGIAGLMAKGQRIAFEAFQRQQAVALAADMAERVRGNRFFATTCPTTPINYAGCTTYIMAAPTATPLGTGLFYSDYRTGAITDCAVQVCDQRALVMYDVAMWDGLLNGYSEQQAGGGTRYGGIVNARGCVEQLSNTSATCPVPGTGAVGIYSTTVRVSVSWQGNDDTVAPVTPGGGTPSCGFGLYGVETKRRIVTYDLLLQELCPP